MHRSALRIAETTDFHAGIDVWFIHGSLPGRLMRPVDLLRRSLTEVLAASGMAMVGERADGA